MRFHFTFITGAKPQISLDLVFTLAKGLGRLDIDLLTSSVIKISYSPRYKEPDF